MGLSLVNLVSEYKTLIIENGQVTKQELFEMLKNDCDVSDKYKNEQGYNMIADKILDANKINRKEMNHRRMQLHLQGLTLDEIAKKENKTQCAIRYWYKANKLYPNIKTAD